MDHSKIKNRLTVVQHVYHQLPGQQPREYTSRFSRELETFEAPYERPLSIGEEWKPLDVGWLKDVGVGMLVIENNEGQKPTRVPTEADIKATRAKVVEVALGPEDPFALVPASESIRFYPTGSLYVRCQSGTAKITIQAFPR